MAIHWLNDDILLQVFNCYRLDMEDDWNIRLRWRKLSHVCQRWRYLVYACAFHLDIHIECTNGAPILDMLNHLPPLPLGVHYKTTDKYSRPISLTEQDEWKLYHALRFHDRVRHIDLDLPPSITNKAVVLLDKHFPMLENLCLSHSESFAAENSIPLPGPLTLPKAFLAPNLRHLTLPGISPLRRLQLLTSTVSLVTLEFSNIQTSSYFPSRLLVARLQSLPHLAKLSIDFSISTPHPSVERKLLGEQEDPVTLPNLKDLRFRGVDIYLESLVTQIRAPLLEKLEITLFNQIVFVLPRLSYLINITEAFQLPNAAVGFGREEVYVTTAQHSSRRMERGSFFLRAMCKPLDRQIDCAAQICHALIPTLSGVEELRLVIDYWEIPTEMQNGAIDSATWHDILRSFIGVKKLYIYNMLLEDLSRALQVGEVGSDPSFLPNLQSIHARHNIFTSFIDTRQGVGRPVQFKRYPW